MYTVSDWRGFEQLVAAIQRAEQHGATVKWDDEIDGRQFDVTVRFSAGQYEYLVVIECKNYKQAVTAEKVDALVTNSRDARANNAIIVSTAAFQQGAIEVARRHGVDLVTLAETAKASATEETKKVTALCIVNVRLHVVNAQPVPLSNDPARLQYEAANIVLHDGSKTITVAELTKRLITKEDCVEPRKQGPFPKEWRFEQPVRASGAPLDEDVMVGKITCDCEFIEASVMPKDVHRDPHLWTRMNIAYRLTNVVTGHDWTFEGTLDFGTVPTPGHFYVSPMMGFGYYCESPDMMLLIESYQHGSLFQARIQGPVQDGNKQLLEVHDRAQIERLRKLMAMMPPFPPPGGALKT